MLSQITQVAVHLACHYLLEQIQLVNSLWSWGQPASDSVALGNISQPSLTSWDNTVPECSTGDRFILVS